VPGGGARAWRALALIEHHRQFARLGAEPLHGVVADADADRQERAEPAVNAGEQRHPFVGGLGAGGCRMGEGQCGQQCSACENRAKKF
jgi:hypothetical protein